MCPGIRQAVAVVLAGALLGSCDSGPNPDDSSKAAEDTAAALTQGLATGDLGAVAFSKTSPDDATADLTATVEGMGDVVPTIEAGAVDVKGDSATATLTWSWPLTDDEAWTYDSSAPLVRVDGEWQVVWGHDVVEPSLNAASVLDVTPVAAPRGDVTGARGLALVTERAVVRVGIDRQDLPAARAGASAKALARLVGVDVAPYVAQVEGAGRRAFVEAISFRNDEVPARVGAGYDDIAGARLVSDNRPLAPTREFAAPIIGSVGPVTAEMIQDNPDRYQVGDDAGLSGLQARYDDQLQGTPGAVVNAVGSDGKEREIFRADQQQGQALALTLDPDLQIEAELLLDDVGPASALVAIRPSTGAILVAANGPGNGGQNLATYGQYAPGSTFKSVSSLALLRAGITPQTPVECTSSLNVDGKTFENYDDYPADGIGQIPFRTALAKSCNTAFISERDRLGDRGLVDAAASLGVGVDHDLGFPAYFGSVKPPTSETVRAADMIGQGTVLASPMAMATVIASVQHGSLVVPRLLDQVDVAPPDGVDPLTGSEATRLHALLRGVVAVGSGRVLADVPGPPVIGKTGTAEFETASGKLSTHAWMIGAQGDLGVAVFVDVGTSGAGTAGPILEAFLRAAR